MRASHIPVMVEEVVRFLPPHENATIVDATIGSGGHSKELLKRLGPDGFLIGVDYDPRMLAIAGEELEAIKGRQYRLVEGNFANLPEILAELDITRVDGVLFDLGLSSLQLEDGERGFSFLRDGPLDARYSPAIKVTAGRMVNEFSYNQLKRIIKEFGEERWAAKLARAIVEQRKKKPIKRTVELAKLAERLIPRKLWKKQIHPATRLFMGLRIFVNRELDNLELGLRNALELLNPRGRIVVISYHSLEHRIVKRVFKEASRRCKCPPDWPVCQCGGKPGFRILTPRPISPRAEEIHKNPRARSAHLTALERLASEAYPDGADRKGGMR